MYNTVLARYIIECKWQFASRFTPLEFLTSRTGYGHMVFTPRNLAKVIHVMPLDTAIERPCGLLH